MSKPPRWMNRLDRTGGRAALGALESIRWSRIDGRRCRVRYRSGYWTIRRPGEGVVVALKRRFDRPGKYRKAVDEIFFFDYTPRTGDVVIDVGAGTGDEVPYLASQVGPRGRVLAFEAHPRTFGALQLTVELNGVTNVDTYQLAVSDGPGEVGLSDTTSHLGNTLLTDSHEPTTRVRTISIDAFVEQEGLERIDYLKMNIEGAEALAIEGMRRSIDSIDHLCISCHDFKADAGTGDDRMRTKATVRMFLDEHGFEIREQPGDSRPWVRDYLYARRSA